MWWMMVGLSALVGVVMTDHPPLACEDARLKCAFREGCGMALHNYMVGCSSVLRGPYPDHCPEICLHSLIALTSTVEGQELMRCKCSDDFCQDAKKRVEACRPNVTLANKAGTIVSCRVAQFICSADNECSTALYYYNRHCKSMFHGKKCTNRCNNSIGILMRQEKAAKLKSCRCDGHEEYDCNRIQTNMASLCFNERRKQPTLLPPISPIDVFTTVKAEPKPNRNEEEPAYSCGSLTNFSICLLLATLIASIT